MPARQLTPVVMVFALYDLADCTSGADADLFDFEPRIPPLISSLKQPFIASSNFGVYPRTGGRLLERCSERSGGVFSLHCGNCCQEVG